MSNTLSLIDDSLNSVAVVNGTEKLLNHPKLLQECLAITDKATLIQFYKNQLGLNQGDAEAIANNIFDKTPDESRTWLIENVGNCFFQQLW